MNNIQIQDPKVITIIFPTTSYPVMYKAYWIDALSETNRIKNNTSGYQLEAIQEVFTTYYGGNLNSTILNSYSYRDDNTPYKLVIMINYLTLDGINYLWEYLDNWIGIVKLNN